MVFLVGIYPVKFLVKIIQYFIILCGPIAYHLMYQAVLEI